LASGKRQLAGQVEPICGASLPGGLRLPLATQYNASIGFGGRTVSSKEAAVDLPDVAVAEPEQKRKPKPRKKPPRRQPRYHVILWNDDDHTYDYVIEMMRKLFGHVEEKAFQIAKEVDTQGKAICLTTTLEHAELKRDQIHAYGPDKRSEKSKGSMSATIQAELGG
jgi:ATP-dependent Clp protease adaptor protein ClpS